MRNLVQTPLFVDFIFVIVVLNGGILCLDGLVDENYLLNLNYSFTLIFTIEMSVKIWGLGIKKYIRDKFNIMDAFIVFISIFEILLFKTENSSIDYLRALRSVRVFRLFKILRHLEYFKRITSFISKNFYSFIYIACLLILFNFVYGMLGMDIFTNILITDSSLRAYSFGDFAPSFICAFDILTLDNWSNVLIIGENSDAGIIQAALYSISWIFIGNYILMNLFLAVLLDGLTNELMEEEINKTKKKLSASSLEKQRLKEIHMQIIYNNQLNSMTNRREIAAFDNNLSITTEFSPKLSNPYEIKPNDLFFLNKSKCNYSLFLFGRRNLIRRICHKIAFHSAFELIILIIIILSCIKMVIDTYTDPSNQISLAIDNVTIGIFLLECLLKIIAKGFLSHEDTYLRESWNQLDFFIVLGSVVSIIFEQLNIPFITVVRILRVMRPLRFISKNANIKIVVVALIESLQGMLNVSFIILMIWIMFATFGVSIYRDRFGYCGDVLNFNTSIQNCHPPLKWKNYTYNFDNIYNAMFTLLVIATFDGWIPILSVAINSNTSEFGPTINYSRYLSYIYFVLFIIVIPVFFINLFIGVIFYHFVISEKKCKNILLTESQIRWINLQKLIIKLEPKYAQMKIPKNKLRKFFYNMVNHRYFEIVISLVICGSIINMSLIYDDAPQWYLDILNVIDQVFLLIFLIEITMKILGFGIYRYFSQKWNQFDFFIMIFGLFDIIINKLFSQKSLLFQIGPKILRTVRMLRIGRLIRLVKKFDGILKLIRTLIFSLPMTFNVLALLLLIFFVYTIIGCSIFGDSRKDEYVNFTNFLFGMMTLFKISTTDNWSETMLSLLDDNIYCPIYFVTFIIISQFVVTNLFILVLLQQFAEAESSQDSKTPLQEFHEYVDKFRTAWIECTEKFQGHKMNKSHLLKFFRILESPLGIFER